MEFLLLDCRAVSAWPVAVTISVVTVRKKRMEDLKVSGKDYSIKAIIFCF